MKQGFLCQEMAGIAEVIECINDWRSQGCRFVYNMDGQIDSESTLVHHFTTFGDLPKDMEKFSDADEELWKDEKEFMQLKKRWKSIYEK